MNMSQIELIVEIANAGSISQAAKNLYISQPSVTKALQRFEDEVGTPIFERVSTGVRLTPIGRRFVDSAKDILYQIKKTEELFENKNTSITNELRICSVSYYFMQRMLAELYSNYAGMPISIKYIECAFENEVEQICKGDMELGITIFWKGDLKQNVKWAKMKGVEYHRLDSASLYIGVSKNSKRYPQSVQGIDLDRLNNMPLVTIYSLSPHSTMGWRYMGRYFDNKAQTSNQEIYVNNTATMCEIVEQIDGFTLILLNQGLYEQYGYYDNIRLIPVPEQKNQAEIGWLQATNSTRSPLANEVTTLLSYYVSSD